MNVHIHRRISIDHVAIAAEANQAQVKLFVTPGKAVVIKGLFGDILLHLPGCVKQCTQLRHVMVAHVQNDHRVHPLFDWTIRISKSYRQ